MQYGRSGSVGGSIPPDPVSLGIQLCLSMCLLSFPRRSLMDQLSFRFTFPFFCMYRMRLYSFERTFGPTVARSISPASVALSFYISVLLNVPHASITLLSALLAPLSLGRSFSSIRKRVFWELWFCVHCRSVGLSWICCCCCSGCGCGCGYCGCCCCYY